MFFSVLRCICPRAKHCIGVWPSYRAAFTYYLLATEKLHRVPRLCVLSALLLFVLLFRTNYVAGIIFGKSIWSNDNDNGFEYLCGFELNIAEFESIALVALLASLLPYNSLRTGTQTAIIRITNCAANSQNCFQYPTNQSMPQRTWWPCLQLAGQYFRKIVVHTWPGWTRRYTCSAVARGQRENYCEWSCLHLQHMVCVK